MEFSAGDSHRYGVGGTRDRKSGDLQTFRALAYDGSLAHGDLEGGRRARGSTHCLPGGPDVGRALVRHPEIATIAFTGSKDVGLGILKDAGLCDAGATDSQTGAGRDGREKCDHRG